MPWPSWTLDEVASRSTTQREAFREALKSLPENDTRRIELEKLAHRAQAHFEVGEFQKTISLWRQALKTLQETH